MNTTTTENTVHYTIDAPTENQVVTALNFHLQGWITFDLAYETEYYFSDGHTDIPLQAFEREDVALAFPDKHVFGFSQTISTIDLLTNRHYFIKFKGPHKEHRLLVPVKIETNKQDYLEKKQRKREKIKGILQCPISGDTDYTLEDNTITFAPSKQSYAYNTHYLDFFTTPLKSIANIENEKKQSSANNYDPLVRDMIGKYEEGLVLDIGAGFRNNYYENVVFLDVIDYPTTDVLSIAERLPFQDNCFDAIVCVSVLQHIKTPSKAASEMMRVLKEGGELLVTASFLNPYFEDPNHYFNFTSQGLKALFPDTFTIDSGVLPSMHPIVAVSNILNEYAHHIEDPRVKQDFLQMKVEDLVGNPLAHLGTEYHASFVQQAQTKLSAGSYLIAEKKISV